MFQEVKNMFFRKQNVSRIVSNWCLSFNLSWLQVLTPLIECFFGSKFNENETSKYLKLSQDNTFVQISKTIRLWHTITVDEPLYIHRMKGEAVYKFRLKINPLNHLKFVSKFYSFIFLKFL